MTSPENNNFRLGSHSCTATLVTEPGRAELLAVLSGVITRLKRRQLTAQASMARLRTDPAALQNTLEIC